MSTLTRTRLVRSLRKRVPWLWPGSGTRKVWASPRPMRTASLAPTVAGRISISALGPVDRERPPGGATSRPARHRHVWVGNRWYQGVEDNDLRGFLDGRFRYAWNQPSQVHVRVGRQEKGPRGGEPELFRVLQRWDGIKLPRAATVTRAGLQVEIEEGVDFQLELVLYEVNKDWDPGLGGVRRNNNSAPAPGEVWWNEVAHDLRRWSLPGAGFASDSHAEADTPAMPLARARYTPGDRSISFESPRLTEYVARRLSRDAPLLFLIKLSDGLEDVPGSLLHLFSANHGDSENDERRPRFWAEWHADAEVVKVERHVLLEHGRSTVLPRLRAEDMSALAVSFYPEDGCESPLVHVRGGAGSRVSEWRAACHPLEVDWEWFEVRIAAVRNPVCLGDAFEAELRDTWTPTGRPEEQEVAWRFVSPTGEEHNVLAEYGGDWRWRVRFRPLEVGRWSYRWTQGFTAVPYESKEGYFDVVARDPDAVVEALERLEERAISSGLPVGKARMAAFGGPFMRLQRALVQVTGPDSPALESAASVREADVGRSGPEALDVIQRVRQALTGEPAAGPRLQETGCDQ
jgi:hypothetical protein